MEELPDALRSIKKGNTPESNGFPVDLLRAFWAELGPFLRRAFLASLT